MHKLMALLLVVELLTSCTYSINLVDTEGSASDVVDETDKPTASVIPTIALPTTIP